MRIMQTIFNPPQLNKVIRREGLFKKLDENKDKKLILLKAGPGYGKTILAASYYYQLENKIWLIIPPDYFSFSEMLGYLIYALDQKINSKKSNELAKLCWHLSSEELIIEIINLILENITEDIYLFIDDFHQLYFMEKDAERLADLFFSFIPSNVHVIITSQTDLPFSVSKLRLADDFYQFEQDDFSLTMDEIDESLRKNNFKPTLSELNSIYHLVRGWIAVLTLFINELKITGGDWKQVLNLVESNISEYIDHILNKLPDLLKSFLIETSIFQEVKVEICNEYLNRDDSEEILNRLSATNLVYKHDEDLFSYHQLLKENLVKKIDPSTLPEKYSQLAEIYRKYGDDEAVITCLIKSGKIEEALKMILKQAEDRVKKNVVVMQRWLELLPEKYFYDNPFLYYYRGQIKERIGRYNEALLDYEKAREYLQKLSDKTFLVKVDIQIAGIYWHKEAFEQTVKLCRDILPDIEEGDYKSFALLYNLLGINLIELSSQEEGIKYLKKARRYCHLNGDKDQEAWILNNLSFHVYVPSGNFPQAIKTYQQALTIFNEENDLNGKALILSNLSHLYLEMNQVEIIRKILVEVEEIYLKMDNAAAMLSVLILQTRLDISAGKLISAEKRLDRLQSHILTSNFQWSHLYLTYSYYYTAMQELDQALFWVEKAIKLADTFMNRYLLLEFQLQKIKVKYLKGDYLETLALIEGVIKISQEGGYLFYLAEALFYEAAVRKMINKPRPEVLQQFADLIEENNYYFLFKKFDFLTETIKLELRKLLKRSKQIEPILERNNVEKAEKQDFSKKSIGRPGQLLKINMFGGFKIASGNEILNTAGWKNKKALNILKYLILNRDRWVLQEQILDIFWPELKFEKARQNLYVALYEIRKTLELNNIKYFHILSQRGRYRFNNQKPYWLDLEEFYNLYEEADHYWKKNNQWKAKEYYLKAKKIYKGELLPENIYDDWSSKYRKIYRKMYINLLQRLLEIEMEKNATEALAYGQEILAMEPYLEDVNFKVIELLIKIGQLNEAINHYQKLKELYHSELNAELPKKIEKIMGKIF